MKIKVKGKYVISRGWENSDERTRRYARNLEAVAGHGADPPRPKTEAEKDQARARRKAEKKARRRHRS
jgi:hypothetical protein